MKTKIKIIENRVDFSLKSFENQFKTTLETVGTGGIKELVTGEDHESKKGNKGKI